MYQTLLFLFKGTIEVENSTTNLFHPITGKFEQLFITFDNDNTKFCKNERTKIKFFRGFINLKFFLSTFMEFCVKIAGWTNSTYTTKIIKIQNKYL